MGRSLTPSALLERLFRSEARSLETDQARTTLAELAHDAQHVFEQVRRCGDSLARECFLRFLAHAANRQTGSGAGRLAQATEPLSGIIDLIWLEAGYQRVRRAGLRLARAFFWLIVCELAVGARRLNYINPERLVEPQTANAGPEMNQRPETLLAEKVQMGQGPAAQPSHK